MSNETTADERALLLHTAVVSDLLDALLDRHLAPVRLTPREFEIATVLTTRGPMSPGEVATVTGVPAPSVSRLVARMEESGLVRQAAHPSDGRSRIVSLTDAGMEAHRAAHTAFLDLYQAVAGQLGSSLQPVDASVRRLEWALRVVAGVPVPDPLTEEGSHAQYALHYPGLRLNLDQEAEVLDYIDWLRARATRRARRSRSG